MPEERSSVGVADVGEFHFGYVVCEVFLKMRQLEVFGRPSPLMFI